MTQQMTSMLLLPRYRIPIELLGVVVIAITAHVGGFLSALTGRYFGLQIWRAR